MLKARLRGEKVDKVYSSGLKRASQTARIIFAGRHIEKRRGLREMNFGIFEGLTYEQIMARYPQVYTDWMRNPAGVEIPRGENLEGLYKRVRRELRFILSRCKKNETVAVVAHGGPNRVFLCDALGFGREKFWQIEQDNAALNIIEYSDAAHAAVVVMNTIEL